MKEKTDYQDARGEDILDGDLLCDPINCYEDVAYWRVFYDEHLQNWYAYDDSVVLTLKELAPFVWRGTWRDELKNAFRH